jgi:hypothetical protein
MKKLMTLPLLFFGIVTAAQEKISFLTPPSSPEATFTQQWTSGEITIHYSRPLARGRKIFGGLVPFDSLWRTGAGGASTLGFTEDMIVGDKTLKAGKYSLFTIPGQETWTIIINTDTTLHGAFGYESSKDVHRFKIKPDITGKYQEAFTIELSEITSRGSGFLSLAWENTTVKIPLASTVDEKVMAEIRNRLITNKEQKPELFYQAANYYYTTGRDLNQAATWAAEAEKADKENFNYPNLLQKILADLKDYKAAIAAAKRALVLAEKKNMTSTVAGLKKRIAEWEK